jgi:O-antigen/teichoic acid export membrane protein
VSSSRTANSARNVSVGLVTQLALAILSFVSRTVFVSTLGAQLLGVNALLVSLLAVLSLADLGLNTAVMYALYRPLEEGDTRAVNGLLGFCALLYRYVALAVTCIGLALLPFVGDLVHGGAKVEHLEVYYLAFVANTVIGYLMAFRSVLLIADQRLYLTKVYAGVFTGLGTLAQILVLLTLHSYLAYVLIMVLSTALSNAFIFRHAGRLYPYIRGPRVRLDTEERRGVLHAVRAMVIYRVGGVILNNTDPILISVIVGTAALGYYSNYMLVVGAAMTFTDLVFTSLGASVGNLIARSDGANRIRVFEEIHLLAFWIYGLISVGFVVLLGDVIGYWLGEQYMLSDAVLVGVVLNFYMYGVTSSVLVFRTATGLFRDTQYVFLVTAALNIVLSVVLGREFGVPGVLYATALSRLLTNLWFEPLVLFRRYLFERVSPYFLRQVGFAALLVAACVITRAATSFLAADTLLGLVAKALLTVLIPNALFVVVFHRSATFVALRDRLWSLLAGRGAARPTD